MEIILEALFWLFIEVILPLLAEITVDAGLTRRLSSGRKTTAVQSALGYIFIGVTLGFISGLFLKEPFIVNETLRLVNLIATPLMAGLLMMAIRQRKLASGKMVLRLDSFTFGALFAFALVFTRYLMTT